MHDQTNYLKEKREIKQYREYIGKLNWIAQMTDPVSFYTHHLSTKISEA